MRLFRYLLRSQSPEGQQRDRELEDFLDTVTARLGDGTWESPMIVGGSRLWVDATGDLRISATAPTSDVDGAVVGTQT